MPETIPKSDQLSSDDVPSLRSSVSDSSLSLMACSLSVTVICCGTGVWVRVFLLRVSEVAIKG
jgi:hypothetical protein